VLGLWAGPNPRAWVTPARNADIVGHKASAVADINVVC